MPKFADPIIETGGDTSNIHIMTAITTAQMRRFGASKEEIQKLRNDIKNSAGYEKACALIREWFPLDIDFMILNLCKYRNCQYPGCPKSCKERKKIKLQHRRYA